MTAIGDISDLNFYSGLRLKLSAWHSHIVISRLGSELSTIMFPNSYMLNFVYVILEFSDDSSCILSNIIPSEISPQTSMHISGIIFAEQAVFQ